MPDFIVAVETNEESQAIVATAASLLAHYQDQQQEPSLQVINVLPPIAEVYADLNFTPFSEHTWALFEAQKQQQQALLQEQLASTITRLHEAGSQIDIQVLEGVPEQAIVQHAEAAQAAMIIMGLHNRHGLSRLLGSTTSNVLNHAPCDLLAVHPDNQAQEINSALPYRHVLICADSSEHSTAVLARAAEFTRLAEQYTILTVVQPLTTIYAASHAGKSENLNFNQIQAEIEQQCQQRVTDATTAAGLDTSRIRLPLGEVKPQILQAAADMQADLIIMGSNARGTLGRLLLGSTTRGILDRSPCDVLVVHG